MSVSDMLTTHLPSPPNHTQSNGPKKGHTIIYAHTDQTYNYPEHQTPFTFLTNFISEGNYSLNQQRITTTDKHFYFLNAGDELAIRFREKLPRKTLLILFDEEFVKEAFTYFDSSENHLLDQPDFPATSNVYIPQVLFI